MDFSLKISHLNSIFATSNVMPLAGDLRQQTFDKTQLPVLAWLKPMQRRRLSPFAKMALHCGYQTSEKTTSPFEVIFSSRHGDLHKTSTLLGDLASSEPLSPTAFSLSVHNAVAGLFSIFTGNTAPSSALSAGKASFLMALVDAYARLYSGNCQQVLLIHSEQALPEPYAQYADEDQIDHAFACLVSRIDDNPSSSEPSHSSVNIHFSTSPQSLEQQPTNNRPLAVDFINWLESSQKQCHLSAPDNLWHLNKVDSCYVK